MFFFLDMYFELIKSTNLCKILYVLISVTVVNISAMDACMISTKYIYQLFHETRERKAIALNDTIWRKTTDEAAKTVEVHAMSVFD